MPVSSGYLRRQRRHIQWNSVYPEAGYPNRLGPSGKSVENSTKLICLALPVIGSSTAQCYGFLNCKYACSKGLDAGTYCK